MLIYNQKYEWSVDLVQYLLNKRKLSKFMWKEKREKKGNIGHAYTKKVSFIMKANFG